MARSNKVTVGLITEAVGAYPQKRLDPNEAKLKETIQELENEYVEMVNWIPSRHDIIQQNMGEQRSAAQERELAQESLILWNSHQLHTAVERELCRLKQEVKRLKNMIHWDVNNGIARRSWARNKEAVFAIKRAMQQEPKLKVTLPNEANSELLNRLIN